MRVVVTRERGANDRQRTLLAPLANVDEVPLTTTRFVDPRTLVATLGASAHAGHYRTLVVTSSRAAAAAALARSSLGADAVIAAVGSTTAAALEHEGLRADVVGDGGASDLAARVNLGPVLVLGATNGRTELAASLRARSIEVIEVACYETLARRPSASEQRLLRAADVVLIGAPSAWRVARDFISEAALVAVPGETTASVVRPEHPRLFEGWGDTLREHLTAL